MSFKATNQHLADGYTDAKRLFLSIRNELANRHAAMLAGPIAAEKIINTSLSIGGIIDRLNVIKNIPGILQYAKDQEDDDNYNVSTEFTASLAALTAVQAAIITAIPKDGNDWLLTQKLDSNGLTDRTFSTAQTADLRTTITAFNDTIA